MLYNQRVRLSNILQVQFSFYYIVIEIWLYFFINKPEGELIKMLKTCSKCGIVPQDHVCPYRTYKKNKDSKANKFRNTKAWARKSIEIRQRDKYLCVVCMNNLYSTIQL